MTLPRFALASTPAARAGAALVLLAVLGLGLLTASPETVIARHFAAALEAAPEEGAFRTAAGPLVSGSEAYWLTEKQRHESDGAALEPAAWSGPLAAGIAVGDRITIAGAKAERVLEVVAVAETPPAPGAAPAAVGQAVRHIAVTCRDLGRADGRLVTFTVPAEPVPGPAKSPRAL